VAAVRIESKNMTKTKSQSTKEAIERRLLEHIQAREHITRAFVHFSLTREGTEPSRVSYRVWVDGNNRRCDRYGQFPSGRVDQTQIVTEAYSYFRDRVDGTEQMLEGQQNDGLCSIPDLRKIGLVPASVESLSTYSFRSSLLPEDAIDTQMFSGREILHPYFLITRKPLHASQFTTQFSLLKECDYCPGTIVDRSVGTNDDKLTIETTLNNQWAKIDGLWFPRLAQLSYVEVDPSGISIEHEPQTERFELHYAAFVNAAVYGQIFDRDHA
jgi:hypothetical protein